MKTISKTYPKILPKVYGVQAVSGGSTLPRSGCPLEDHPLWNLAAYTPGPSLVCWDDYGRTLIQKSNPAGDRCDLYIGALTAAEGVISGTVAYIPSGTAFTLPFCKMLNEDNVIGARVITGGVIELVQRLGGTWTTVWTSGADAVSVGDLFELIFRGTDVFVRVAGTTLHQYALPAGLQGDGYAGYQQHRFDDADTALVHDYRLSLEVPALEWFVRPASGAPYGNGSGINYDNAWGGLGEDDFSVINPGDTVYYSGLFDDEGYLNVVGSGLVDKPIYLKGNLPGKEKGIIDTRTVMTGTWVDQGSNIWFLDTSAYNYSNPRRIWADSGSGLEELQNKHDLADLAVIGDWIYIAGDTGVYMYSDEDPFVKYTEMRGLIEYARTLYIYGQEYIQVSGFEFRGGYWASVAIASSAVDAARGIIIENCDLLLSFSGANIGDDYSDTIDNTTNDVVIKNNNIDSLRVLPTTTPSSAISDAVFIGNAAYNIKILHNYIKNWSHTSLIVNGVIDVAYGVFDIELAYNYVTAPDIFYCKGFGIVAFSDKAGDIRIHHNIFYDVPVQSQIACPDVYVYFNVFDTVRGSVNDDGNDVGLGLALESWLYNGETVVCEGAVIANNTFINVDMYGLRIANQNANTTVQPNNNLVANNIFYDCGKNLLYSNSILIDNWDTIHTNTFKNNCILNSDRGVDDNTEINYRDTLYSVSDWNSADLFNDVIEDNISADPQLDGYHIPITSPAYEAGIWIPEIHAGAVDIDGDPVDEPVSIGCDEGTVADAVFYNQALVRYNSETVTRPSVFVSILYSARGTVTGQGIDCGSDCIEYIPKYGGIELTAAPNSGYYFHSWIESGGDFYSTDNPLLLTTGDNITLLPRYPELKETETPCMTSSITPMGRSIANVHYDDGTYNLEGWKGMSCTAVNAYDCWCTPMPTDPADLPVWVEWRYDAAAAMTPTRFRIKPRDGMSGSWYPENNPKEISLNIIKSDDSEVEVFRIVNENWNDDSAREWTVDTEESGIGVRLYIHSTQGYDDGGDFHTCVGDFHVWGTYPAAPDLLEFPFHFTADSPDPSNFRVRYEDSGFTWWIDDIEYASGETVSLTPDDGSVEHVIKVENAYIANFEISGTQIDANIEDLYSWNIRDFYGSDTKLQGSIEGYKIVEFIDLGSNNSITGDICLAIQDTTDNVSIRSDSTDEFDVSCPAITGDWERLYVNRMSGDIATIGATNVSEWFISSYAPNVYGDLASVKHWDCANRFQLGSSQLSMSTNDTLFLNSSDIRLANCNLDQQSVDNILRAKVNDCQNGGPTGGNLDLLGNAGPSSTGAADAETLRNTYGWTVDHEPVVPDHPTGDDPIGDWEDEEIGPHDDTPIGGTKK